MQSILLCIPAEKKFFSAGMQDKPKETMFSLEKISKRMKPVLMAVFLLVFFTLPFFNARAAVDTGLNTTMSAVDQDARSAMGYQSTTDSIEVKVGKLIGQILSYVGVIFFVFIVWGGLKWMTAQGNDKQVAEAKELIINATIGLLVVLSAYAITNFIGTQITT
ncbi:hypothetical protein HGA64_01295 [Candidatus Falkowbacteria bacterium]|nr:hypothetical protein [Candidatus Falkowbacteria bacterium]